MPDNDSTPITTRRSLLRHTGSMAAVPILSVGGETDNTGGPPASEVTPEASDLPWDFDSVKVAVDAEGSPFLARLAEHGLSLPETDVAMTHFAANERAESSPPPDTETLVVSNESLPDQQTVDEVIDDGLRDEYVPGLPQRFDPELTVRRYDDRTRWIIELDISGETLWDIHSRHRVAETLVTTQVRSYEGQIEPFETAKRLERGLHRRRRRWTRDSTEEAGR